MRKVIVALLALLAMAACSSVDCPLNHRVYTSYRLYQPDGTPDTLGVDTLWILTTRANGTDSVLLNRLCGPSVTGFELPVSYTQPEDTFLVMLADTLGYYYPDSIFVRKENLPHFESVDCQASFFHRITSVRCMGNIIDSIVITNSDVNYDASTEHIRIYLNPGL